MTGLLGFLIKYKQYAATALAVTAIKA